MYKSCEYWSNSAQGYDKYIQEELNCFKKNAWKDLILKFAPQKETLNILDIGTGPGFFLLSLADTNHKLTGIDLSENMLNVARNNLQQKGREADLYIMNADKLKFEDESFDLIISRNVTWTLEKPEDTYKEWHRVLKKNGRILVFDSNWFYYYFNNDLRDKVEKRADEYLRKYKVEHDTYKCTKKADEYRKSRPLSRVERPAWDAGALLKCGFGKVYINKNIMDEVYDTREKFMYGLTPMFLIMAKK